MKPTRLATSSSVFLDTIRFAAAVVVLWSHVTQPRFTTGLHSQAIAGHLAVCVFFVLSGFVIRMVTRQRIATWRMYLADRASRMYSVVLPCLLLTFLVEISALTLNAERYHQLTNAFDWTKLSDVPRQFVANLTFTSELWGYSIDPMSNSVFWSIPYECFYYALYGVAFYSLRAKWIWIPCLLILAGPAISMFFPLWLLGCIVYDGSQRMRQNRHSLTLVGLGVLALLGILFGLRHEIYWIVKLTEEPVRVAWTTRLVTAHFSHANLLLNGDSIPWLSMASPSFFIAGVVTAAGLLWTLLFLDKYCPNVPSRLAKTVRIIADSTFTLYLAHLPLLILISTCVGHPLQSGLSIFVMAVGIILVCIPMSLVFDRFKLYLRKMMQGRSHYGPLKEPALP
jgi:peptidoglycan/LPS O-acetylase OafA/YrhL